MTVNVTIGGGGASAPEVKADTSVPQAPSLRPLEPIAVVGMACRLPGDVCNPSALWELLASKKSTFGPVPESRFTHSSFYHPLGSRLGSLSIPGGHFLSESLGAFDASFFSVPPYEANSMDPQQRLLLEVTWECLESAGIAPETLEGKNVGVYVGAWTCDYETIQKSDIEGKGASESIWITGTGPAILSNRVSYVYNFRGPSMTIDTGCSASAMALHVACQALRDETAQVHSALVGATNLFITPEIPIYMANMGVLSSTGGSKPFDARADGYGRGEGVDCIFLKRLSDALRDGDPIRALIRSSAVNADGRTMGLAAPSALAQEMAIREAYAAAGITRSEFNQTAFIECHGTGTKAGDPMEAQAIGKVFGRTRRKGDPLYIGSIKPNIGHGEGASALNSVLKAILSLEAGKIPPNVDFVDPSPKVKFDEWRINVPTKLVPWPQDKNVKRVSVSSYGYGGANGHIVLDDMESYLHMNATSLGIKEEEKSNILRRKGFIFPHSTPPDETHTDNTPKSSMHTVAAAARPFLLTFSAKSDPCLKDYIKRLGTMMAEKTVANSPVDFGMIADLAYTLGVRRSLLPRRTYGVFPGSAEHDQSNLTTTNATFVNVLKELAMDAKCFQEAQLEPKIGFIFTGQGAQWPRMGAELLKAFPLVSKSLENLERVLKKLPDAPGWNLRDELERSADTSKVNDPQFSQVLSTAVQLCLVDLLRSWNILPRGVVGHSSGEIAASYAAGALSSSQAIILAYYRGLVCGKACSTGVGPKGGMLAVGLGKEDAEKWTSRPELKDKVVIACVNSPQSVTISGDSEAIGQLQQLLAKSENEIFARRLKVPLAYHSHHMLPFGEQYQEHLEQSNPKIIPDVGWVPMFSSVTGDLIEGNELGASYWRRNLESPVLFSDAVQTLLDMTQVDTLIEIGPHSALSSPIRDIRRQIKDNKLEYLPSLIRERSASISVLELAGGLYGLGYTELDLAAVNGVEIVPIHTGPGTESRALEPQYQSRRVLVDLPAYSWDRSQEYWLETRRSKEWRFRKHPRHDILGSRVPGINIDEPQWMNVLSVTNAPWLKQHQVQGRIIFPAAGYISMGIEALTQYLESLEESSFDPNDAFLLRQVTIEKPIVLEAMSQGGAAGALRASKGVEVFLSLKRTLLNKMDESKWFEFVIRSTNSSGTGTTKHCSGLICPQKRRKSDEKPAIFDPEAQKTLREFTPQIFYEALESVGYKYDGKFRDGLRSIKVRSQTRELIAEVDLLNQGDVAKGRDNPDDQKTVLDSIQESAGGDGDTNVNTVNKAGFSIAGELIAGKSILLSNDNISSDTSSVSDPGLAPAQPSPDSVTTTQNSEKTSQNLFGAEALNMPRSELPHHEGFQAESGYSYSLVQTDEVEQLRAMLQPEGTESDYPESRYVIHPGTIDLTLQLCYFALHDGRISKMEEPMVPIFISEIYIAAPSSSSVKLDLHCKVDLIDGLLFPKSTWAAFHDTDGQIALYLKDMHGIFLTSLMKHVGIPKQDPNVLRLTWTPFHCFFDQDNYHQATYTPKIDVTKIPTNTQSLVSFVNLVAAEIAHLTQDLQPTQPHFMRFAQYIKYILSESIQEQIRLSCDSVPCLDVLSMDSAKRQSEIESMAVGIKAQSVRGEMVYLVYKNISSFFRGETDPFELFQANSAWSRLMQGQSEAREFLIKNARGLTKSFPRGTILEVGGGTGANTSDILGDACTEKTEYGPPVRKYDSYTFTDVSLAFVSQAKEHFQQTYTGMQFQTLDLSKDCVEQGFEPGAYDIVFAFNVLHATPNISVSLSNIKALLRPGGKLFVGELVTECISGIDYPLILGTLSSFWKAEEAHRQLVPLMSKDAWALAFTKAGFTIDYLADDHFSTDGFLLISATNNPPDILKRTTIPSAHVHVESNDVTAQLAFQTPLTPLRDHKPIVVICGQAVTPTLELVIGLLAKNHTLPIVRVDLWSEAFEIADAGLVVSLVEVDESLIHNISETVFARVKSLLVTAISPVLWVTNGVHMAARNPLGALITGLARAARNEHIGSKFHLLDLTTNEPVHMAKTIIKVLSHLSSQVYSAQNDSEAPKTKHMGGTDYDWEFCEYDGLIHVPRITLDNEAKLKYLPQSANHQHKLEPFNGDKSLELICPHRGMLSSLVYEEIECKPLPPDWIEITPEHYGLNFHDIGVAMGFVPAHRLGVECIGRVNKVGSAVTEFKPGDEVFSVFPNGYSNRFQAPAAVFYKCQPGSNLLEISASLVVYITVIRSLKHVANLGKGEKILIHSAAGGVGIAAINYAKLVGAEIFATCGNDEKRAFLTEKHGIPPERIFSSRNVLFREAVMKATDGVGVDVILNSLSGEALAESWKCLAPMGRFIELGKHDLIQGGKLDLSGFMENRTYSAVDLSSFIFGRDGAKVNLPVMTRLVHDFQELYNSGQLPPISPITRFGVSEIEQAFRYMSVGIHMGKIMITPKPGEMVKVSQRALSVRFDIDPDATYILIGGLGGIGCNLAVWMAENMAKHITLLSRSRKRASDSEEEDVQTTTAALTSLGCEYQIVHCDVGGDFNTVENTLVSIAKQRKIKGLVHAAMVLKDGLLEKMSYEDFQIPLRSKVHGLLNIQRAFDNHPDLASTPLDFFVVLSSLSGIIGSGGQANYAAASTFEDAFVQFRQRKGQPASVLDLAAITKIGYVSRNPESQKFVKHTGISEMSPKKLHDAFRMAIGTGLLKPEFESEPLMRDHDTVEETSDKIPFPQGPGHIYSKAQSIVGMCLHELSPEVRETRRWVRDPKWGIVVSTALAAAANNDSADHNQDLLMSNPFKDIDTRSMDDVINEMTACIIRKTAQMTMIPVDQIQPTHSLQKYGIDSLVAVELRHWLLRIANVEITVAEILATTTIGGLAERAYHAYLAKREKGGSGGGADQGKK